MLILGQENQMFTKQYLNTHILEEFVQDSKNELGRSYLKFEISFWKNWRYLVTYYLKTAVFSARLITIYVQ